MSEATRKAVVTLAQVNSAFAEYVTVKGLLGEDMTGHSFDRGNRGKGFAHYDQSDSTVRTFDTKEDALTFYGRYVEVAREVMDALGFKAPEATESGQDAPEGTESAPEAPEAPESAESAAAVPAQRRRRVAANK